ncbi:hypothetical protein DN068_00975 [Taibaiella soli]|uniref:Hint domain-containing protein n=2 Tax=Taibaiella soli TaxID=1649169 RepID=A0A2W2AHQ5_9BACT|nr:hypothetical protein DN068_00975 [Taibaiella soli]
MLVLFSVLTWAQNFQYLPDKFYQQLTSSSIANNPNFSGTTYNDPLTFTTHDKWQDAVNAPNNYTFKSIQDFVRVGVRRDTGVAVPDYEYNVAVQIKCYNAASFNINNPANIITAVIPVTYHPASGVNYNDLSVYKFSGYQGIQVFITGVYDKNNPTVPIPRSALARNFYVESSVEVQRADLNGGLPSVYPYASYSNGSLLVSWGGNDFKPIQYDLEWLYVDDYHLTDFKSGAATNLLQNGGYVQYDFRNNSTRVRVSATSYSIPLIYEHGVIVYRVRAVQPVLSSNYKDIATGGWSWSTLDFGTANSTDGTRAYLINSPHMNDKLNWQYTINFAEEGKYKHVINYFDGSLKGRQTQTKINTDDNYIVALDKIYDYEGRPEIQTLPVPVLQNNLSFRTDVTINNATGKPYTAADFDNGCVDPAPDQIAPLQSAAKANVYYSPLNPDQSGMQKYVPDAHGYPFVETIYSPDNTNKVLVQGGAGIDHQLWKGHGTKYEYVRANQTEIDRLLGTEAGISQFYPKQVVTDPNGQSSFSIINPAGKVVATGLLGDIDTTDKPLNRLDNFIPGSVLCNNLLQDVVQQKQDDKIVAETAFYVDNGGATTSIQYSAATTPLYIWWCNKYLNAKASFTVRVTDDCGRPYMNPGGGTTVFASSFGNNVVTTSGNVIDTQTNQMTAVLGKGAYLVKKEIAFSASGIKDEVDQFVRGNANCFHDSLHFIRTAIEAAKFPCVDSGATNMCDQRKKEMMKDLWPGGKYGGYAKANDSTFAAGVSNSIFTSSVLYNPKPSTATTSSVINGNTVVVTRIVDSSLAIGAGSQSTIYSCSNSNSSGICNCPDGAHPDTNPCCAECLAKGCKCIKFITYHVSETTTVNYPPVTCDIAARAVPGLFTKCSTSSCNVYFKPGSPTNMCYPYSNPPSSQPLATDVKTVSCSQNHAHTVWLMDNTQVDGSPDCIGYRTTAYSFSIFYDYVQSSTPTPDITYGQPYDVPSVSSFGYRYQSSCVGTLPHSVSINGVKYTSLASVDPQALIDNFSDSIAEALLPLHPEYCKLLACNDGPFEQQLENLNTWQQALTAGMFMLDDIINKDPMYVNATASAKSGVYQKLAYLRGLTDDDKLGLMALKKAYCGAGNGGLQIDCAADLYSPWISGFGFINDAIKQKYFELLKGLYTGNREYLKQQNMDQTGNSCGPCQGSRMTLTDDAVFTQIFDANGNMSASLTGMPSWMADLFTDAQNGVAPTTMPSQVLDSMRADSTLLRNAIITNIVNKLKNCSVVAGSNSFIAQINLKASLSTYLQTGARLTPDILKSQIAAAGYNIDDLCHPFLTAYDIYDVPVDAGQTYNCASATFYSDMASLLSDNQVETAIIAATATGGTQNTLDLSLYSGNSLVGKIQQYYAGVTGSQPSQLMLQAFTASSTWSNGSGGYVYKYIKLKILPSTGSVPAGKELYFYIRGRSEPISGNAHSTVLNGATALNITNAICLNNDPMAMNFGYVAGNTAVMLANVGGSSVVDSYYVWNNQIPFMEAVSDASLSKVITCPEIKKALEDFQAGQATYGYDIAANHPLYEQTLTNYLNYYFNKQYGFDDYYDLMNGCAVTDKLNIPKHSATARIRVSSAQLSAFMTSVAAFTDRDLVAYKVGISGSYDLYIDMNAIPDDSLGWYKTKLTTAASVGSIYFMENNGLLLFAQNDINQSSTSLSPSLLSGSVNITQTDQVTVEENGTPINYTQYTCLPKGSTAYEKSQSLITLKALLNGFNAYTFYNGELLRSDDYNTTVKQDYLNYVYNLTGSHDAIVAAIDPAIVKTATSQLSGDFAPFSTLTYQSPVCTSVKTDLYAVSTNNTGHPGFARLLFMMSQIQGYPWVFPTVLGAQNAGGSSGNSLYALGFWVFKKANGAYWYRYFDATNHVYNVYITPPSNTDGLTGYKIANINTDLSIAQGDDSVKRFNVVLTNGANTITCSGYTDFPIGYGKRLQNVVLFKDQYQTVCFDSADCERDHLNTAIQNGLANYYQYFDSLTKSMAGSVMTWMLNNTKDTLILCTQDQKYQYTLYYYDRAGNLTRTVPPAGVNLIAPAQLPNVAANRSSSSVSLNSIPLTAHKKVSTYRYNSLNQLVYQQTPDGGITYFFYDAAGRLVFSQNSKQRPKGNYSYTLYDDQSRVEETGEVTLGCTLTDNPNILFDTTVCSFANPSGSGTVTSVHPPYVANADLFKTDSLREYVRGRTRFDVVVTVYDTAVVDLATIAGENLSTQENLRKRVSSILYFHSLSNTTLGSFGRGMWYTASRNPTFGTYYSYDMLGNVKTVSYGFFRLVSLKQQYKRVDYDYDLLSGKVNMVSYNRNRPDQFYQKYEYDADNRITKATTSNDGVIWNTDARYTYYKHGPLATVKVGENMIQSLEYAYTIQGWLKAINGDVLMPQKEMGQNGLPGDLTYARDAIAHTLDYFQNDYGAIGGSGAPAINLPAPASAQNLWNGNIVRQTTSISGLGNMQRSYRYDQLQRLKLAQNAMVDENALTVANPSDIYKSNYSYDPDGNIKTLQRWNGSATGTGTMPNIDNFTYNYTSGNTDNKLQSVADAVTTTGGGTDLQPGQATGNYQYDKIGNLIKDVQGNMTIDWNLYGKVKTITFPSTPNKVITFDYDGAGNRVFKEVVIKYSSTNEDHRGEYYVHDASGNILTVLKTHSTYSPLQIISSIDVSLLTAVGQATLTSGLVDLSSQWPGFSAILQTQALSDMPTWVQSQTSATTAGGYMLIDGDIFTRMVYSGTGYLSPMRTADLARSPIYSGIIPQAFLNRDLSYGTTYLTQLFGTILQANHACTVLLQDFDANVPSQYTATVWRSLGVTYREASPALNAQAMHDFIFKSPATYAPRVASLMNTAFKMAYGDMSDGSNIRPFAGVFVSDNGIFNDDQLIQPGNNFYAQLRDVIYNLSPKDYITSFFDTWPSAQATLASVTTPAQLLNVQYNQNPSGITTSFFNNATTTTRATAIANVSSMTTGQYVAGMKAKFYNVPPAEFDEMLGPAKDTISLSEHHIYGSSRLGIQNYDSSVFRSTYDAGNNNNSNFALSAPAVWYNYSYADVIDKNYKEPWGHTDLTQWTSGRTVGKRNYELTDHLGNVLATVLDRKTGHINGSLYDYYFADVASAADYYPGGMPMPGRRASSSDGAGSVVASFPMANGQCNCGAEVPGTATFGTNPMNNVPYVQMNSTSNSGWIWAIFNTTANESYSLEFDLDGSTVPANTEFTVWAWDGTNSYAEQTINQGHVVFNFVAHVASTSFGIGFSNSNSPNTTQYKVSNVVLKKLNNPLATNPNGTFATTNSSDSYRFGFNGKMKDNEIYGAGNFEDYGMRGMDTRLNRFWGVDPLTKQYPYYTPYQFAGNKPTRYIDRDGLEEALDFQMQREEAARANRTMTDEQIHANQQARGLGALLGGAIVLDAWTGFTGSKVLGGALIAGDFYDNPSTSEAENQRRNQQLKNDVAWGVIGYGAGKFLGKAAKVLTPAAEADFAVMADGCFVAGTKISTSEGLANIESIKVGDTVWSFDKQMMKKVKSVVAQVFVHSSHSLVAVYTGNTVIYATSEHPFFANDGWKEAKDLNSGDTLLSLHGNSLFVDSIKSIHRNVCVYNFEVKRFHNYFVSEKAILVHNACNDILRTFKRDGSPAIDLNEGNTKWGFEHILQRHSADNFLLNEKGDLFPAGTTDKQIFEGIQEVYSKGTRASGANRTVQTFEKRVRLNGKTDNYRLIVDTKDQKVVSFFPIRGGE